MINLNKFFFICFATLQSPTAFSWGARGHDMATQAAVKVFEVRYGKLHPHAAEVFKEKAFLLGYLSNVPDVYWKSLPRKITKSLNPSHYVDLEYVLAKPSYENFPLGLEKFVTTAIKNCPETPLAKRTDCSKLTKKTLLQTSGSATFRVGQFYNLALASATKLKALDPKNTKRIKKSGSKEEGSLRKKRQGLMNEILLNSGLLSHFVADLAQPLHTTADYDGWEVSQGGLHSYCETAVIDEYPFGFFDEVVKWALDNKPSEKVLSGISKLHKNELNRNDGDRGEGKLVAVDFATSLSLNSFALKEELFEIDRKFSLIKASKGAKKDSSGKVISEKVRAKRRSASEAADGYREFTKKRLAMAADSLAFLWHQLLKNAGNPSFKGYKSYYFPTQPQPTNLDYLGDE